MNRVVGYIRRFFVDSEFRHRISIWLLKAQYRHKIHAWVDNIVNRLVNPVTSSTSRHCNICGWSGWRFQSYATMTYYRPDSLCPVCGSLPRYRALATLLEELSLLRPNLHYLEIAPATWVRDFLNQKQIRYTSLDLGAIRAQVQGDVQLLPFFNACFDVVICFHVLEFVPDWQCALYEFRRVLSPSGIAILSENYLYGQEMTIEFEPNQLFSGVPLRRFGDDFPEVILASGFDVDSFDYLGLNDSGGDYIFIARPNYEIKTEPIT